METPDYKPPPHEPETYANQSRRLGRSVGRVSALLRALREGGVKDRLLLLAIGSLSIWCLSWSFETGTGLLKDGMIWMAGPREEPRPKYLSMHDEDKPDWASVTANREAIEAWEDRWESGSLQKAWDKRTASRNKNLLLNPRRLWPNYALIQKWSGKVGLLLVGLWLLLWMLRGKKQNELTE